MTTDTTMKRRLSKYLVLTAIAALACPGSRAANPTDSIADTAGIYCIIPPAPTILHDDISHDTDSLNAPTTDPDLDLDLGSESKKQSTVNKILTALIPSHAKMQFYGGIGLASIGCGWDYGGNKQWETDLLIGIVPKYNTNSAKLSFTIKETFEPWSLNLGRGFSMRPLTCGLYVNTISGSYFWSSQPKRYPDNYYPWLSTRIRIHIFIGQSYTFHISNPGLKPLKAVTAFYEVNTNDLYLVSAFSNHLALDDIIRLSFGFKLQLR